MPAYCPVAPSPPPTPVSPSSAVCQNSWDPASSNARSRGVCWSMKKFREEEGAKMPPPVPDPVRSGRAGGAEKKPAPRTASVPSASRSAPGGSRAPSAGRFGSASLRRGRGVPCAPRTHFSPYAHLIHSPPHRLPRFPACPGCPRRCTAASRAFSRRASRAPREEKQGKGEGFPG